MSNFPTQSDPLDPSAVLTEEAAAASITSAPDAHRAERTRRIKLSLATALLFRPLAFVIPIVTIPLFLKYLGTSRYGLYESVGALAAWLGITQVGLGMGLMNRLIECSVSDDRETARRFTSTFTLAITGIVAALSLLFSVLVWFVPWHQVLGAEDPAARSEATVSVWIAGLMTMFTMFCGLPGYIYSGYQEIHRFNVWDGAAKVGTLVACVLVVQWPGLGVPGVLLASLAVPNVIRAVNFADLLLREKPWLRPSLKLFDWQALKWMINQGVLMFVLQMSTILLFQTDKLIIAVGRSAEEVTGYAILGRVFLIGYGVFMLFLTPIWPAMGEAVRRNDLGWVSTTIRRMSIFGVGAMLLGGAALLFARGPMGALLTRLAGEPINVSTSLILATAVTFAARAWVDSRSIVLNATGVLMPQIPFYTGHAVLNAVVSIAVVRRWGVEGVAWTTAITTLLTSAWGYPWLIRRYIMNKPAREDGR
jgi:O-antigen/teichoic acid export membrane protein